MERGGPTTQSGIYYQNSIAAIYLGKLIDPRSIKDIDRVVKVRVEAPTIVDDIVIDYADNHRLYVQVKESVSPNGKAWTKMWLDFCEQFCDNNFQKGHDILLLQNGEPSRAIENLKKLCSYAKESNDYKEWKSRLNKEQTVLVNSIDSHIGHLLLDKEQKRLFYAHIIVKTDTLDHIETETVLTFPECNLDPHTLLKILRDRAGGKSRVRGTFTAPDLVRLLKEEDDIIFEKQTDIDEINNAIKGCSSLLRQTKRTIGGTGKHISRDVIVDITQWIHQIEYENNVAVLLDQAGMGKSAIMGEIVEELEANETPVLAIKADLQLAGIKQYYEISERLGLPETIDRVAGRLASQGTFVLVIDQVDALSLSMAHDQTSINLILEMVARLRSIPGVLILLSCRKFDYYNDPRINSVEIGKIFELLPFSDAEVRTMLDNVNVNYNALTFSTQKLLKIPLHLNLFVMAVEHWDEQRIASIGEVASLHELYQMIWDTFIINQSIEAPPAYERIEVLMLMTDQMNISQTISVKKALFTNLDKYHLRNALLWLASSGIIVNGKNEWAFFHQTFFDYCYARKLIEEGFSVSSWLKDSDQGLFCRPQIIQVLTYLRESDDMKEYLKTIAFLLQSKNLRFHIKDLVRRWFGAITNPSEQECLLVLRMLQNKEFDELLKPMFGNVGWFRKLRSTIENLIVRYENVDDVIIPYLNSLIETEVQGEIVDILSKYLGKSEKWSFRIGNMLYRIDNWRSSEAVDLLEELIRTEPGFNLNYFFDFEKICEVNPLSGCRIVRVMLDRLYENLLIDDKEQLYYIDKNIDTISIYDSGIVYNKLANQAPELYLNYIYPWLENVILKTGREFGYDYKFQQDALSEFWYDDIYQNFILFINSIECALCNLNNSNREEFLKYIQKLQSLPYATTQQLVARVYTKLAKEHSLMAFEFLIDDSRRLNLGKQQYISCQLIMSCFPYLTRDKIKVLECAILEYLPIHKYDGIQGLKLSGLEQFYLLKSIPRELLTPQGLKKLMEWERKFPGLGIVEKPKRIQGGFVESPISKERMEKMSDLDWYNVFNKYKGNETHKELLKGGAPQIARLLQEFTKDDPERFYHLALSTQVDVDDCYKQAFCEGLALSEGPNTWVFEVCLHFAKHHSNESMKYIAWALDKRVESGLPDEINIMLEKFYKNNEKDERDNYDNIDSGTLNSVRAVVFKTLCRSLAFSETEKSLAQRWNLLNYSCSDPCTYVRAVSIGELKYMLLYDRDQCVEIFKRLMDGYSKLLESHETYDFCRYGIHNHFNLIWPYIKEMLYHKKENCRENGSRLATIAAISSTISLSLEERSYLTEILNKLVVGCIEWKKGAADVLAHNFTTIPSYELANLIIALAEDESDDVRSKVTRVCYELRDEPLNIEYRQFILRFVSTKSMFKGFLPLTEYLWANGIFDPQWTIDVIELFLNNTFQDPERQSVFGTEKLIRLILRINTDPLSNKLLQDKSMDIFDHLMERFSNDVNKVLTEWDRR